MASPNWVVVLIQFSILTHFAVINMTRGDCVRGTQGTYKPNSIYQRNLNDTLSALTEEDNGDGFFTASSGSAQDDHSSNVSALALCPGNFDKFTCVDCVKYATDTIRRDCPSQKKATGWYYGICMLSYSNSTFDMAGDDDDNEVLSFRTTDIPNWDSVYKTLAIMSNQLVGEAHTDDDNQKRFYSESRGIIQATLQCIPNTPQKICADCLVNATKYLRSYYNRSAEVVVYYRYPCFVKYKIDIVKAANPPTRSTILPPAPSPFSIIPPIPSTTPSTILPPGKKGSKVIGPAVAAAAVTLAISTFFICIKVRRICIKKGEEEELLDASDDDTGEIIYFRLNVMQAATRNFSVANKLGEGGFGPVYWGELSDGRKIALKRLSQNSSQGMQEFKTEVKLIIKLQHKNLVRLLGCCMKGKERLLVYEYMSNSSLDKYIFDPKKAKELDWAKRVNIVNGIAKGLRYLHEDSRLKIIHRDLKASNVLLDEEMNPKISDFGTARIFGSKQVEANTDRVVGTYGYMAPEYAMEGMFSIKSDVYSFGVLLLEIISGKRNSRLFQQDHDQNLLSYAWMLWAEGKGEELIDENLNDDCPVDEALKWLRIALLCIEEDPNDRPTISSVTFMLEGEWKSLSEPKPPLSFGQIITYDPSSTTWNGDDFGFYSSNSTLESTDHHGV